MKLFTEFPDVSTEDWEALIIKDLKGQDYNKKLIWNSEEGIQIRPYYRKSDITDNFPSPPGMPSDWDCVEEIRSNDPSESIKEILIALESDVTGFKVISNWKDSMVDGVVLSSLNEITEFMRSILEIFETKKDTLSSESRFRIFWDSSSASPAFISAWTEVQKEFLELPVISHFFLEPLSDLTLSGKFSNSSEKVYDQVATSVHLSSNNPSIGSVLSVNVMGFSNSGGNLVQELGFALSMGTEYINQLIVRGIDPSSIAPRICFRFSVGSNFFAEIAKFRAFRFLWNRILEAYGIPVSSRTCHIATETTEWNLTVYDPYVNMLRVTTSTMSAILGGTNSHCVYPFDRLYSPGDRFSKRIARNVQHLIRHESYINKAIDPSNGSYYLESLTKELGEKSWTVFQEIDALGGYVESLKSNYIQKSIQKVLDSKVESILNKKSPILGISQFPNPKDETPAFTLYKPTELSGAPFNEFFGEPDFKVDPLIPRRASEEFENLRNQVETKSYPNNRKPQVYLLLAGHRSMRTARASFATNFLSVVGAEIINTGGTEDPEEKITEIIDIQPDIIVYCSSDEEYLDLVRLTLDRIRNNSPNSKILVAGNPESSKELASLGIQGFIHVRSHLYNTLKELFL